MHSPSLKEFLKLSKQGNVIPVYKEINADCETPVSAFLKTCRRGSRSEYAFLLESVEGQEKVARYSFLGHDPALVFQSKGARIQLSNRKNKKTRAFLARRDPLDEIKRVMRSFKPVASSGLPRFWGGFVGFLGYDIVRFFEEIPDKNPDTLGVPDALFVLTETLLVFDHVNHTVKLVVNCIVDGKSERRTKRCYRAAVENIDRLEKDFHRTIIDAAGETKQRRPAQVTSNFTKPAFEAAVRKAKAYIKKGDIIQVVPSQRFQMPITSDPFTIYRNLRSLNPSPYMFYFKFGRNCLVGASPEMLVRCEEGLVQTRPIAGTRPRGSNEAEDKRLEKQLCANAKERAEHVMLVDLGRNDLGRICSPGSVTVHEFMNVERYSHVMHLVSEVRGHLDKKYDCYDCLRACFPAGTVSGSPKIRAMEIIDELENTRRGPYAGCVGYFSFLGNMDTCITIRTILIKDGTAYVQAGGGVVAD
jgi:anthranilate synthase component 1